MEVIMEGRGYPPKASRRSTCSRFVTIFTRSSQARRLSARPSTKLLKDGFSNLLFCCVKQAILHQPRDTSTIRFSCGAGSNINATTFAFPLHHMRQRRQCGKRYELECKANGENCILTASDILHDEPPSGSSWASPILVTDRASSLSSDLVTALFSYRGMDGEIWESAPAHLHSLTQTSVNIF